jgi:hypothetical protein
MKAVKKDLKAQYIQERDEKLKALGQEKCDEFFVQKMAEVKAIAGQVDGIAEEDVQIGLEEAQGTSEAGASESAVPKATDNSVKVSQESGTFTTISPSSSIPTEDTSILDLLKSHCEGELSGTNLQKASEVASKEITSESPQHQAPEPQKISSPQQQPSNTQTEPQMAPSEGEKNTRKGVELCFKKFFDTLKHTGQKLSETASEVIIRI